MLAELEPKDGIAPAGVEPEENMDGDAWSVS